MRIPRVYVEFELVAGAAVELDTKTSHYLSNVLRLREQAPLILFDGRGHQAEATITVLARKAVQLVIHRVAEHSVESPLSIHLGIAVSRGERMDWIVQKATELGVAAITPLLSERTEVKLKAERADKKIQHWQQIAISACEQCGRNRLPMIHGVTALPSWLTEIQAEQKWVLHHRTRQRLDATSPVKSVALLVGPEGGLSDDEIHRAEQDGFAALGLGPRVLRTETAPVAAISLLQYVWGDMQ